MNGKQRAAATGKRIPREVKLLPVIRCLYDAATDADKWLVFLEELAYCFDARGAQIVRLHPREQVLTFSVLYGYDDAVMQLYGRDGADRSTALARYEEHFQQLMPEDPRIRILAQFPGRPLSCRLSISDAEMRASRVYQDMLVHADVEYSLLVSLSEDDGSLIILGVFRGKRSSFFSEHEAETFSELIPHLKQAISISEHLARVDFNNRAAFEALDCVRIGIVLVDKDVRVMHANATAARVIDLSDGIGLYNGVLRLQAKDEDARLRRAIWNAIMNVRVDVTPPGEAMAITRPSGNEPFAALVSTLWGNHLRYRLGRLDRPLAVLFLTIPEEAQEAPAELLRRLFGLTLAEARICELLVSGNTVEGAARKLDIATDTVRVHLKSVFGKVGVHRQAELIAKILGTPVWLRHENRQGLAAVSGVNGATQRSNRPKVATNAAAPRDRSAS